MAETFLRVEIISFRLKISLLGKHVIDTIPPCFKIKSCAFKIFIKFFLSTFHSSVIKYTKFEAALSVFKASNKTNANEFCVDA